MAGPLDGIRVIDFTTMVAGPYATMILADQGADVIKVEAPLASDHARRAGYGQRHFTAAFVNNNRNKRSMTVDAKTAAGREAILRLAKTADVFAQNFRPGVMARLGLDEPDVRSVNAGIVYLSISGWGETGPLAHKPVYDPIIQALSGLATVQAGSDDARPRLIRTILPDKMTGITAAQAVSSALLARERTGEGQHVRVSMLDAIIAFMWASDMGGLTFVGKEVSVQRAATFIDLIYETRTDYISVSVMTDTQWEGFCRAVERPEWVADERFNTPAGRDRHADETASAHAVGADRKERRSVAVHTRCRRRSLRSGAESSRGRATPAGAGERHRHRDRPPTCRTAAAGAQCRAVRTHSRRGASRRATPGRAHGRGTSGTRLLGRGDRRAAGFGYRERPR